MMTELERQELIDRCTRLLMLEGVTSAHSDGRVYRYLHTENITMLLSFKPVLKLEVMIEPNPDTGFGAAPAAGLFDQRGQSIEWGKDIEHLGPGTLRKVRALAVLDDLAQA